MPLYKIADVIFEMNPRFEETSAWYTPYLVSEGNPEFIVEATDKEIDYFVTEGVGITPPVSENMVLGSKFHKRILNGFNGGFIHSSALMFDDKVYLFSGPSGVGKSTHTRKWLRLFPDRTKIINDDRPTYRFIDGKCYIYGSPFAGGTDVQLNEKGELGGIVFLEQSDENRLVRLNAAQAVREILQQTTKAHSPALVDKHLSQISDIIEKYPIYKLYCANNDHAVEVAFQIVK